MLGNNVVKMIKIGKTENGTFDLTPLVKEIVDRVQPIWNMTKENVEDNNMAVGTFASALAMTLTHFAVQKAIPLNTLHKMLDKFYADASNAKSQGMN